MSDESETTSRRRRQRAASEQQQQQPPDAEAATLHTTAPSSDRRARRRQQQQLPALEAPPQPLSPDRDRPSSASEREEPGSSRRSARANRRMLLPAIGGTASDSTASRETDKVPRAPNPVRSSDQFGVFTEGEESLTAGRAELAGIDPSPEDMAADYAVPQVPLPELHRAAPPLGQADQVYKQGQEGNFEVVPRGDPDRRKSARDFRSLGLDTPRQAVAGPSASGGLAVLRGGLAMPYVGSWYRLPASFELKVASACYTLFLAPTRFIAAIMAGAVALEGLLMAQLESQLNRQVLTPLFLYAPSALVFYSVSLYGSLGAMVGVSCQILVRSGGEHYLILPWRWYVDIMLLLIYFSMMWLTYSGRQTVFDLPSRAQAFRTPHFGPTPQGGFHHGSTSSDGFDALEDKWSSLATELVAKQALTFIAAVLTFIPSGDEGYEPVSSTKASSSSRATVSPVDPYDDATDASSSEHVVGLKSTQDGGLSMAIGFWTHRKEIELTNPPARAPDGSAAQRPLPLRAMNRRAYAARVNAAAMFLTLDVIANLCTDTIHWEWIDLTYRPYTMNETLFQSDADELPGTYGDPGEEERPDLILSSLISIAACVGRLGVCIPFVRMLTATKYSQLGLYGFLQEDFGGSLCVGGISFFVRVLLTVIRIARGALAHAAGENALEFFTSGFGIGYSVLFAMHLTLTALFYVKALMALKRVSNSVYYVHPGQSAEAHRQAQAGMSSWGG